MDDLLRKLIDLAVSAGEKRFSLQTEYIHLKYNALSEDVHYPIPVLENLLFALALFRTRTIENMTRGKLQLEKILYFQGHDGNFPIYLHEYPDCKDHYLSLKLIPAIYWILKSFGQVLGNDLKLKTENALLQLVTYSLKLLNDRNPPFFMLFRIAASVVAVGKLLNLRELQSERIRQLENFTENKLTHFEPKHLAEIIISLQMVDSDFIEGLQPSLWKQLFDLFDPHFNTYIGPLSSQDGFEPEVTLYDIFMGYFSGRLSKRSLKDNPLHLHAALIQPRNEGLQLDFSRSEHKNYLYYTDSKVFKLVWGSTERLHTLCIEGGNIKDLQFSEKNNQLEFIFNLGDIPELEDKEMSREIVFYFDIAEKCHFTVDGVRANTFQINEEVKVDTDGLKFGLKFDLVSGAGQFLGHFMRGNRPSQIATKGQNRFAAFDHQIFLRTIRRDQGCKVRAILTLIPEAINL